MRILAVSRAERFSPNSVERDKAIFQAVIDRLQEHGNEVRLVSEDSLENLSEYSESSDLVITMARQPETLMWLKSLDVTCINSPEGIERCTRSRLLSIMEHLGTPVPPQEGRTDGCGCGLCVRHGTIKDGHTDDASTEYH